MVVWNWKLLFIYLFLLSEPIKNVSLTVSKTNLVEFNDSVTFTCTVRGTPLVFSWHNGSSVVTVADVQRINDGSRLTISNVTRYDSGPFSCSVENSISNGTSRSISLDVSCEYNIILKCSIPVYDKPLLTTLHIDLTLGALLFLYSMAPLLNRCN